MTTRRTALSCAWLLPLAGCGGAEREPTPARPYEDPGFVLIGEQRLHYALTLTTDLPPEIAAAYGVERRPNLALLTIALEPGDATNAQELQVDALAISLLGDRQPLALRRSEQDRRPTWVATLAIRHREPVTIEIRARRPASAQEVVARRTREFYVD